MNKEKFEYIYNIFTKYYIENNEINYSDLEKIKNIYLLKMKLDHNCITSQNSRDMYTNSKNTYVNGVMIIWFNNDKVGYSMSQYLHFCKNKLNFDEMIIEYEYIDGHWKLIPCKCPLNIQSDEYVAIQIE